MTKQNKLRFNKRRHEYTLNGKKLTPVTEFIKSFFIPFDPKIAKYIAKARRAKGEKCTAWDVRREWKKAADEGTYTHKEIERVLLADGTARDTSDRRAAEAISYINNLFSPLEPLLDWRLYTECKIADEELGLAGTADLIVRDSLGHTHIFDWKTNKEIKTRGYKKNPNPITGHLEDCNYEHYGLQLATYAFMLERGGNKIIGLHLVHLKEGSPHVYHIEYESRKKLVEEMLRSQGRLR